MRQLWVVLGSVMVLWGLATAPAHADEIEVRADEWLPYNGGTNLKPPGYMIEMAMAIAARNGHTIDYRHMPWDAAKDAVRDGQFDCVVGAYASEAEGMALPKRGWGKANNAFFALNDSTWRYTGMDSLKEVRVGVVEDYDYDDGEFDAYIEANRNDPNKVVVVPVVGRAIVKLIARLFGKKIDVFVEDANVAASGFAQAKVEPGRIVEVGVMGEPEDVYIACTDNAKGQQYAQMFDQGLDQLVKSGELARILAQYGVADWTKNVER